MPFRRLEEFHLSRFKAVLCGNDLEFFLVHKMLDDLTLPGEACHNVPCVLDDRGFKQVIAFFACCFCASHGGGGLFFFRTSCCLPLSSPPPPAVAAPQRAQR